MANKSTSADAREALLSGFQVDSTSTCWRDVKATQLHRKRYHHCSVVLPDDNYILVVGGYEKENSEPLRSVEVLDRETKKWDKRPKLNEKRALHAAALVGNVLYVFGGQGTAGPLDSIECFDLETNKKWVTLDLKLSTPTWGCAAVTVGPLVYILGGKTNDGTVRDEVHIIDTAMHKMYQGPSLNTPRYGSAAVVLEDCIYVVGGQGRSGEVLNTIEYLPVVQDKKAPSWQTCFTSLATPRMHLSLAAVSHCLVAIGGKLDDNQIIESVQVVDTKRSQAWACSSLTRPLFGCTVECLENEDSNSCIVVIGGFMDGKPSGSLKTLQLEYANHDEHIAAVESAIKETRSGSTGGAMRKLFGRGREESMSVSKLKSYLKELKQQGSTQGSSYDHDDSIDDIIHYFDSELPSYDNGRIVASKELKNSGQARVYKGIMHSKNGGKQEVAIKVFKAREDWDDCKQELMTLLKISGHPNVMGVLDFFEVPMPAFVMRYISGGDLRDHLDKNGRMSGKRAVALLVGIGEGLGHLHSNGIVHRDLKSLNIMLEGRGRSQRPVLIDLSLGKSTHLASEGTQFQTRGVLGTAGWMAPEMASSARWSTKTDMFSLGVVMWEILTGKYPFPGMKWDDVIRYIVCENGRPDNGQMIKARVSQSHQELVKSLWQKSPAKRPSVDEFLARLQNAK